MSRVAFILCLVVILSGCKPLPSCNNLLVIETANEKSLFFVVEKDGYRPELGQTGTASTSANYNRIFINPVCVNEINIINGNEIKSMDAK